MYFRFGKTEYNSAGEHLAQKCSQYVTAVFISLNIYNQSMSQLAVQIALAVLLITRQVLYQDCSASMLQTFVAQMWC